MANERGHYGKTVVGADPSGHRGSSVVKWIVGGLALGGVILWAKHQAEQIEKLSAAAGLPQQSFGAGLREQAKELTTSARTKIHKLTAPRHSAVLPSGEEP
jgi:hypothetical protein